MHFQVLMAPNAWEKWAVTYLGLPSVWPNGVRSISPWSVFALHAPSNDNILIAETKLEVNTRKKTRKTITFYFTLNFE